MDVLIVDDDRLTRQGLMRFLPWEAYGLRVAGEASNGLEALKWMEHNPVELVLCDLEMPGMQGLELIQKASALYPRTYFVVLTIHTDFTRIQQALRLGAIDYIAKTDFDRESYAQILQRIVERVRKEKRKTAAPAGVDEQTLSALVALDWLWNDQKWQELCTTLKHRELPPARCKQLCEDIVFTWNDRFRLITQESLVPPEDCLTVSALLSWLDGLHKKARKCFTALPYSREIFLNIIEVGQRLKKQLDNPVRISTAANYAHMSRSYFCQCFRDIYHMSFLDYMRAIRLEKAVMLLVETNKTVQTIALELGYNDEKYFSRIFRSHYGVTPMDYRKKARS